jgi:hypothetical protein
MLERVTHLNLSSTDFFVTSREGPAKQSRPKVCQLGPKCEAKTRRGIASQGLHLAKHGAGLANAGHAVLQDYR